MNDIKQAIKNKYACLEYGYMVIRNDLYPDFFSKSMKNRTKRIMLDIAQELHQLYIQLEDLDE